MKKENTKKYAFSLAEALITLLIVCLITLASIPVLTKKRRTVTDGGSGQWICTLAAQKDANGNITGYKHVYWYSQTSDGDINDPSTWDVAGDGTSCTFAPPLKAKNFAVTLIGGGGGGADGVSDKKVYMDASKTSYTPEEDGEYRLALIGGGGGGCGTDDGSKGHSGGGGGGGAMFAGTINLKKDVPYSIEIGKGNPAITDTKKYTSDTYRAWAGASKFKANGDDLIVAYGGQNGGGTGAGAHVWGGYAGNGGKVIYKNLQPGSYSLLQGGDSYPGRCDNGSVDGGSGQFVSKPFYGASDSALYGAGGSGNHIGAATGYAGADGFAELWQIHQYPGKGGSASALQSYVLANIKGKLVAKVGEGGNPGEDGKITYASIYDSQGNETRSLKSPFGAKGGKGDSIAQISGNDQYVYGEKGSNSFWLNKGGGEAGKCNASHIDKYRETYTVYEPKSTPIGKHWKVGFVTDTKKFSKEAQQSCPKWNGEQIPCVGFFVNYQDAKDTSKFKTIGARSVKFAQFYTELQQKEFNSQEEFESWLKNTAYIENPISFQGEALNVSEDSNSGAYNITKSWYPESSKALAPQLSSKSYTIGSEPVTLAEIIEHVPVEKERWAIRTVPAQCTKAGDGTYFGAGGGGGGASNQIGLSGKGGRGAPGAVIIEW